MELLVVSDAEVRQLLPLDELAGAVSRALVQLSDGVTSVPPRIAAFSPAGLLGAMPGYVPDMGLAVKLVSVYPHNPEHGAPAHQAVIAVFDESTGRPRAVMGATYITAIRTAVTSAVAARALMPHGPRSAAVIGSGVQADAHLTAFNDLLDVGEIRVSSRDAARASALAARHPGVVAAASAHEAVDGADIVLCCTDSGRPVVDEDWIAAGVHVGSVGSGEELPAGLLDRAGLFVESRTNATAAPPAGAAELRSRDPATLVEIGEVLSGRHGGRAGPREITVFKSTGHAVEDIAAAAVVLRKAVQMGAGTTIPLG